MLAAILKDKLQDIVLEQVPDPIALENENIINVRYAALNHRDYWIMLGKYAGLKYPIILSSDLCGQLETKRVIVNPGFNWGDNPLHQSKAFNILGLPKDGSLAEKVSVHKDYIYDAPEHLSDAEAAALPLAGITAYRALVTRGEGRPSQKVFITGIGGGVALTVLQFALALNMDVYVSSS